jgi:hypothetical protein
VTRYWSHIGFLAFSFTLGREFYLSVISRHSTSSLLFLPVHIDVSCCRRPEVDVKGSVPVRLASFFGRKQGLMRLMIFSGKDFQKPVLAVSGAKVRPISSSASVDLLLWEGYGENGFFR